MKKGPETLDRVMGYLTAEITVEVVVPKERPVCRYCQGWLDYDERVRRHYCRLTQEPLVDPDGDIWFRCPLRGEVENA